MNIVVVGCGRQGRLHLRCLARLRDDFEVRVVGLVDRDPHRVQAVRDRLPQLGLAGAEVAVGDDLAEIARAVDLSTTVVDVVTTNSAHHAVAASAAAQDVRGIIVEKPIADSVEHARCICALDRPVYVMESYVFSDISRFAGDYVRDRGLTPRLVKTEFSKDRRQDSAEGRGMLAGYSPHVFDVEIPHQIALARYLLGPWESVCDAWCHDMILPDGRIADHGEGAITLLHRGGATSYNFSCLQGFHHLSITYRTARIYCEDGINVFCYYPSTVDLSGSVLVYRGGQLVERYAFVDDSLTQALRYALSCCRDRTPPVNDARFGCSVLDVITTGKQLAQVYP